ncbi:MAG: hypothetical protein JXX28_04155 [Deltaproteobacteria bacterium]|nr:hypothetical protein [Deltaproteobacteria bacterium]
MRRLLPLLALAACTQDNGLTRKPMDQVAVITGDFDDVREPLKRLVIRHDLFDGLISTATWDEDYNPDRTLTAEGLLASADALDAYDAVLLASGTRGLGLRQYNGVADDSFFLTDSDVIDRVRSYGDRGHGLLVTDWAYDLVEAAWPELVDFAGEDSVPDRAQCGQIGEVTGRVVDARLVQALGTDTVALSFNFSNWAVMEAAGDEATVWIEGDVRCVFAGTGEELVLTGAPLLVSRESALGGVVVSSFHLDAQRDGFVDAMLMEILGDLRPTEAQTYALDE